jgi:lysophospholipase L1-like esterase
VPFVSDTGTISPDQGMKKSLFAAVLVLLALSPIAAGELLARWLGLGEPIVYATNSAWRYAPVPNQRVVRRGGAEVTIGPEGLRGLEPWAGSADHRVLFIGDSVTWGGTNIDDDKVFPHLVCGELEARAHKNFVCGNAGVNGYGTDNMILRLRYDPAVERADTVVVTLISADPIRGTSDMRSAHFFSRTPWGPLRGLWEAAAFCAFRVAALLRWDAAAHDERFDIPVAKDALQRLYVELRAVQRRGKTVLVVFSPHKDEFFDDPDELDRQVRADLAGSGLQLLDLTQSMHAVVGRGVYVDNVHLNELGHALYGRWIADALSPMLMAATAGEGAAQ